MVSFRVCFVSPVTLLEMFRRVQGLLSGPVRDDTEGGGLAQPADWWPGPLSIT